MINSENQKLLDRYIMICKNKGLTPNSINAIGVDLKLFLEFIGNKHIKNVTHIDCDDFLMYCMNSRDNHDWALARKHTSINMFFKTLIKKDYLEIKNPMDKVDQIKVRKRQRGHLTTEEVQQVFHYLEENKIYRELALFSLLFSSGIRLSELYQLNRSSLNFETKRFSVIGKGEKERTCIFSEYAKQNILKYLETRDDDLEPLFISRQKNRLSRRAIQNTIKNTIKRAGINKEMTTHHIRHSCAMHLLHNDIPLDKIQKVLGHSNISTTQIYAYNTMDDVQDLVERVF